MFVVSSVFIHTEKEQCKLSHNLRVKDAYCKQVKKLCYRIQSCRSACRIFG